MKEYNTYIFDLDGTLLYTLSDLTASINHTMKIFRLPLKSEENVRQMVGNGIARLVELAVPGGADNPQYGNIYNTFMQHYLLHSLDTTRPYDGITETLAALKRAGKNIAVVSNKHYDATTKLCQHFFSGFISVAIGESDRIKRKPAPDTVVEALRQLGANRDGAVYIGDSEVDILTAQNSGIPCISVLWGFRDKDFLTRHGARTFISSPSELLSF